MLISRVWFSAIITLLLSLPVNAQQSPSTDSSSSKPSDPSVAVQNDQSAGTDQKSADDQADRKDKKKDSKLKRKLKGAAPSCIGFSGGSAKCRHSKEDDEESARQEAADQQLRQRCRAAEEQKQGIDQPCADLRKRDAVHDVEVGDTYLEQKSYVAAAARYRLALQGDPTNATAMFHLAQVLEKTGNTAEAYEQYKNFLSSDPPADDAKKARAAMDRLRPN